MTKMLWKLIMHLLRIAEYVYNKSFLSDAHKAIAFLDNPDLKVINKDPAFSSCRDIWKKSWPLLPTITRWVMRWKQQNGYMLEGVRKMKPIGNFIQMPIRPCVFHMVQCWIINLKML